MIRCDALSEDKDSDFLEEMGYAFFPIQDAVISCGFRKTEFEKMNSKLLLANINRSSGFGFEKK